MSSEDMRRAEADAKHLAMMEQAKVRGAEAKSPKDWMELFREITEHSVKVTMEGNGAGDRVVDALKDWRPSYVRVARELEAHGMPLTEEIELEGPTMGTTTTGLPIVEQWPMGVQVKFHWPDGSMLHFKGNDAMVAVAFWMWWVNFQDVHRQQIGLANHAEKRSRIIMPGTPESIAYGDAKRKDLSS